MKIALVPFNPVVGDIYHNTAMLKNQIESLISQSVDFAIFPELAIGGYPPKDLLDKPYFIADIQEALSCLIPLSRNISILTGFVHAEHSRGKRKLYNAAAFLRNGTIEAIATKNLLPTYDVFDEHRYFDHKDAVTTISLGNLSFGISICEDLWFETNPKYRFDPIEKLAANNIDYLINIAASPYEESKLLTRFQLLTSIPQKYNIGVMYVNQLGGNDSIVFDGGALFLDKTGTLCAQKPQFQSSPLIYDMNTPSSPLELNTLSPDDELIQALTLGIRDYVHKCKFQKVVIGLSGGIDSAVTAVLAVKALGKENVIGVSMPSRFSSEGSKTDAQLLAENLEIEFLTIPIESILERFLDSLTPHFSDKPWDITEENIQARIRGSILMALSNKHGWMVLTTGNKSELAVGYCTLYGDMCGGLAVISDVFKTRVYSIARTLNRERTVIPPNSLSKPPSAELRHNQTDQDSLPHYDILDTILKAYIEEYKERDEIVQMGFDKETVLKVIQLVDRSEYKRKQAAPGLKVSRKAFGEGRRIPIVQNYLPLDHCNTSLLRK